jgi:hypothetical protein
MADFAIHCLNGISSDGFGASQMRIRRLFLDPVRLRSLPWKRLEQPNPRGRAPGPTERDRPNNRDIRNTGCTRPRAAGRPADAC